MTTQNLSFAQQVKELQKQWDTDQRWKGVERPYSAEDVVRLRGSVQPEYTYARNGADKLWQLIHGKAQEKFGKDYVNALGALTGGQAVQQVKAGLQAIYLSGWQVAADNNSACSMYPDQSLYPVDSVPTVVERINNSFARADQIQWSKGVTPEDDSYIDYFAPIVADAEAGFGGVLNAYELMKRMIQSGAAGVHFEDQLASVKKCGHMGGKVLVPTQEAVQKLSAARLAADVAGTPTLIVARTGERTAEGFYRVKPGIEQAISRGLAYAPFADLIWCETAKPDLDEARQFAEAVHAKYPGKLLAYNCSPSFNWKRNLDDDTIAKFQRELAAMGYKFQFITLAGVHNMWYHMFELAHDYARNDMSAYVKLQQQEFDAADKGYTFVAHQQEVGTGYFDELTNVIQGGLSSVTALKGSTEEDQFKTSA